MWKRAINAARTYLPANLPSNPSYRKVNPADSPIMILGLTSDKYDKRSMYDSASTIMRAKAVADSGRGAGQCRRRVATRGAGGRESAAAEPLRHYHGEHPDRLLSLQNSDIARGQITNGAITADIITNDQISQSRRVQAVDHRLSQRSRSPPVRRRRGTGLGAEHSHRGLPERHSLGDRHHFPPAGRQHHPDQRPHSRPASVPRRDAPGD